MGPRKEPARPALPRDDEVTEAGVESFPASDPPAYNLPGRAKQHERALQDRTAAAREAADPLAAIEQGMGRQNVRIGSGHVPTEAETDPQVHGPGRAAVIVAAVLLAALVIWVVLI
jgi:hypothetical protein